MSKKPHRNENSVRKRIGVRILKFSIFLIIPAAVFLSAFQLENVAVTGSARYTPEQIRERVLQSDYDSNTLLLYLKHRYFKEVKIPFVEKMTFELVDRHSINIRVYEKKVTGCVEFMGEFLYFDKDGMIVESTSERLADIPQIKGLNFNKIILYEKLEVQKEELFDVILNLTQQIEKYGLNVNTISFNSDYEVTLDCGDIKALLGRKKTYDEVLSRLKNMIDKSQGMKLTIDMRNETGTFIAKPEIPTD